MQRRLIVVLGLGGLVTARVAAAQPDGSQQPPPPEQPPAQPDTPAQPPADPPGNGSGSGVEFHGAEYMQNQYTPPTYAAQPPPPTVNPADIVSQGNDLGYRFGSYGRISAGDDLRGGKPEKILVGSVGPRIVESNYLELDMSYGFVSPRGVKLRPVITLALDGTLFHDTGDFDAKPALRNLFLDAEITKHLTAWVGSRMYRGDDIYLFDYWPLDNQNTVGGGVFYRTRTASGGAIDLAAHGGVNRLNNPFQFEQIQVADPAQGAATVVQLNRQHLVASATATYTTDTVPSHLDLKLKLHGEAHALPSGTFRRDDGSLEPLPSDTGFLIGGEVGAFGLTPEGSNYRRHLNLFARYAKGLAAFDPLSAPTTFGPDLKTKRASELSFGASGAWDAESGNVMIGALARRFVDSTGEDNFDDGWEYAVDARPLVKLAPDWFAGADVSYEARFPRAINPSTLKAEDPAVFQIAPMIVFSPMGPSAYDRPQIRVVYRAAHLNDGALDLYVPDDPRHGHAWVHFIGLQAEWWFNSSTYR